jgi:hypothetical protein
MTKFNDDKWNFPEDGIEWLGEDVNKIMLKEINEINSELEHNTLFIASCGQYIYKCVYVPEKALDGSQPVLFKGAEEKTYIAAYSKEFIEDIIRTTEEIRDIKLQDKIWNLQMQEMVEEIAEKVRLEPPSDWLTIL